MPNFWMLSRIDLQIGTTVRRAFYADQGDLIRMEWEPEDIFFETASHKRKKLRKGYRGKVTIETFVWNDLTKADFLRMCMNSENVEIVYTEPVFSPDLGGYHLVFESLEVVEMYSDTKFLLRATARIQELLPNIPALEQ
jgi:hypothetical protein